MEIDEDANFVEFASAEVVSRVSDVLATRLLRQIRTKLSRDSSGIDSFYVRSEILFVRRRESESTFYRNFALKDVLSSREVDCRHLAANVNVSTRDSRNREWNSCRK